MKPEKRIKLEVYRRHHNAVDAKGKRVKLNPGEKFDGTERELRLFPDRLRRADEGNKP